MFEMILENIYKNAKRERFEQSHCHRMIPGFKGGKYEKDNTVFLTKREHCVVHFLRWKIFKHEEDKRAYKMIGVGPKGLSHDDRKNHSKDMNRKRLSEGTHNFLDENFHDIYVSEVQKKMVEDGTHNFTSDFSKYHNGKRVEEGTHHWLGENNPSTKKWKNGTHSLIGKSKERVDEGTHNFLGENNPSHKRLMEGTHNFTTKLKCPHCGKEGKGSVMNRWHFDNCKMVGLP